MSLWWRLDLCSGLGFCRYRHLWPRPCRVHLGTSLGAQLLRLPCCPADEEKAKQDPSYYLKNTNTETRETLQELYKEFKGDEVLAATMKAPEKKKVDKLNAVSRWRATELPAQAPPFRAPRSGVRLERRPG